jgi:hypothetical protein
MKAPPNAGVRPASYRNCEGFVRQKQISAAVSHPRRNCLATWRRPLSRVYIGIEDLYSNGPAVFYRPQLPARAEGVRALLRVGA